MSKKTKDYILIEVTLFMYIVSLIIFSQLPTYAFISVIIGMLLVILHLFFSVIQKKELLFMNSTLYIYSIFFIFTIASILWSTDMDLALIMNVRMAYLLITIITIYSILQKYDISSSIHYGIIFGIFLNFILYFDLINVPIETWLWLRYQGTTGNPNVLAIVSIFSIFSSIILLYIYRYKNYLKYLHITNIIISIFLILITASKKGILFGSLLLFIYLLFSHNKFKKIIYIAGTLFLGWMIAIQYFNIDKLFEKVSYGLIRFERLFGLGGTHIDKSSQDRMNLIKNGLEKFSEHPYFGFGIDNFRYYFNFYAHNNYVELLFDVGIIGTVIYYMMYIILIKKTTYLKDKFLKYMIISLLIIVLIMDIALVSYYYKFLLTYIILISYYVEKYRDKDFVNDR